MAVVGGYNLDLYCDTIEPGDVEFSGCSYQSTYPEYQKTPLSQPVSIQGFDRADARKQARKLGWQFCRDGGVLCPYHRKKNPKKMKPQN